MTQVIKAVTILRVVGSQGRGREFWMVLQQQLNAWHRSDRYCFHSQLIGQSESLGPTSLQAIQEMQSALGLGRQKSPK